MESSRRILIKQLAILSLTIFLPIKDSTFKLAQPLYVSINRAIRTIIEIIENLHKEGSSLVLKTLNGKKYVRDAETHYPNEEAIKDNETKCTLFFHAHRNEEFGHFHTFIDDENGNLIHLVMISVNENGFPIAISTLNRWVTDDHFIPANKLKEQFLKFKMNDELFPDKRINQFISSIFTAYKIEIFNLFDERDNVIDNYISINAMVPFEDDEIEILSTCKIDIYEKSVIYCI